MTRTALALAAAVSLSPAAIAAGPEGKELTEVLTRHNRGVGLMERHLFAEAAGELERVVKAAPGWAVGHVNLGIAYMNTAKEYPKAERAFLAALKIDPQHPHAHFALGVMLESLGRKDEALVHMRAAAAVAGDDPDVQFKLGQLLQGKGDMPGAEAAYRRASELAPDFASPLYALGLLEVRQGKKEAGKAHLDLFEKLRSTKEGRTWGLKYTEMGRYADVIRLEAPGRAPERAPAAALKLSVTDTGLAPGATSLAVADLDADGDVDILAGTRILSSDGGKLADATDAPLGATPAGSPSWLMDTDNDGTLEIVVPGRIHRRSGGAWDSRAEAAMAAAESLTIAEMDSDGDMDIVLAGKPASLLVNNRDGTFRAAALDPPLSAHAVAALAADLDGDVDTDLVLLGPDSVLQRNDRLWRFQKLPLAVPAGSTTAAAGDVDGDGDLDLLLGGSGGAFVLRNRGGLRFEAAAPLLSGRVAWIGIEDMDRDGRVDAVVARVEPKAAIVLLRGDGMGSFLPLVEAPLPEAPVTAVALDVDRDGDLDVAVATAGGVRLVTSTGAEKLRGLAVSLQGPERAGEARSNRFGVGARVEVKSGGSVQIAERGTGCGPSSSLGPLHFGLGQAAKADYVRVVWPDGVIQSEPEVPAGDAAIPEVQRKAGSCPTLFAWDGRRFAFVGDFLGGGGIGFFVAPGVYGPPDPTETMSLPGLTARDGRLELRVLEPLEEISYLDALQMVAVEHPSDVTIYPDERFALAEPMPTGRALAVRRPVLPVDARDELGRDVRELLAAVDRRYVAPRAEDPHFLGLASDSTLTLRFAEPVPDGAYLFLHGFIEYGYSGTVFAAAQAGRVGQAPTLDYRDPSRGTWTEVGVMGYPAGTPRMMTYPLDGRVPPGVTELRIRTNMTISWDQAFVARDEARDAALREVPMPVVEAELRFRGYPREFSPDGAEPLSYDYESTDATRGFRRPAGRYTRFGDVRHLLSRADDMFAIVGPGEEIALAFDATAAPSPPEGRAVSYLLLADGFCKDMDLYTAHGETVEPLPFHAMSAYPYPPGEGPDDDDARASHLERDQTRLVPGPVAP